MMPDALRVQETESTTQTPAATVLIVDQDADSRRSYRDILQQAGYCVEEAVDGKTALHLVQRILPDIILLDASSCLEGPPMWLSRVRADLDSSGAAVILVAGPAVGEHAWPGIEACFDEFLEKPLQHRDLLRRMRSMSRLRRHRQELVDARSLRGEQTRMWGVLLEFARSVDKIRDLDELLELIVTTAAEMTSSQRVSLMLPDEQQQFLTVARSIGLPQGIADSVKVPLGEAVSGHAFASGRAVTRLDETPSAPRGGYTFKAFVSMPMIYSKLSSVHQRVGVLNISNRYGDRAFEEWELEFIDLLGSIAGSAIDEIHSRHDRESLFRIERDLQLARQIQQSTFPARLPMLAGFEIDAWTEPAEETGGDTYDVIGYTRTNGGPVVLSTEAAQRAVLMLADATGHGIGPALSVTQVRAMLRMAVRMQPELARIARHLNEQLLADLPEGRFITAWLGEINVADSTLTSFSAGQGPILRYEARRDSFDLIEADTVPLGITSDFEVVIGRPIHMQPGDILAVISDGVFEASGPAGAQFGIQRTCDLISAHRRQSPSKILTALREAVAEFTGNAPPDDDRTAIIVRAG